MLTFLSIIRVKIGASKKGFIEKDLVWTSCEFTTAHGAALHSPVVFTYARPGPRSSCAWQLVASRLSSLCGLPRCNPKSSPVAPPFPSSEAAQVSSKRPMYDQGRRPCLLPRRRATLCKVVCESRQPPCPLSNPTSEYR